MEKPDIFDVLRRMKKDGKDITISKSHIIYYPDQFNDTRKKMIQELKAAAKELEGIEPWELYI